MPSPRDEPLVELETDKVTIEVPAPAAGRLEKIAVKDGETVGVGALLGMLAEGAAGKAAPIKAGPETPQPSEEPKQPQPKPAKPRRRRSATPTTTRSRRPTPTADDAARAFRAQADGGEGTSPPATSPAAASAARF